ncbi:MAG: hypothetical protein RQ875_13970 [Vicingaceae bacterium]|nr:hypothetical protein [Vicingaceae bacterium]
MKTLLFVISSITCIFPLFAQINLIPNPGFELGQPNKTPSCNYDNNKYIEEDILWWKSGKQFATNFSNLRYNKSWPDWHGHGSSCTVNPFSYSRHIYLQEKKEQNVKYPDAIRVGLFSTMNPSNNYIFKISFASGERKTTVTPMERYPRVTVHLTKYSEHWSSNWGNTKFWFSIYPPFTWDGVSYNNSKINNWAQHWHILNGPLINSHPFMGNIFKDLKNIVLDCSGNHAYIDYVELSENCPNPLLIENHQFYENIDEIPYKAGSILKAGFDVGNPLPNGNVVVNSGAKATFKAGSQIILEPGFIVEQGADFETIFEPCNSNTAKVNNEIIVIDDKTIQIGDITIYDDRVETLACNDTLRISGLDGDTTSFVNYFWDFGNGQTSNSPVGEVFYETYQFLISFKIFCFKNKLNWLILLLNNLL